MTTVLGYGSLLNVASLQDTVPRLRRDAVQPVLVTGFRRLFNLVSLSRAHLDGGPLRPGQAVGVLNAVPDSAAREMGAVAFAVTDDELAQLNRREYCYYRVGPVEYLDFQSRRPAGSGLVYSVMSAADLRRKMPERYRRAIAPLGVDGLLSRDILPHDGYLGLCLQGAYSWGRAFGDHFLDTTWLADGQRRLRQWLAPAELESRLSSSPG